MTRVLRYEVPVDDRVHDVVMHGDVLHVATRRIDVVEVWGQDDGLVIPLRLTVVGTGHEWPRGAVHLGTALVPGFALVWHLLLLPTPSLESP